MKDLSKECAALTSKSNPSICQNVTTAEEENKHFSEVGLVGDELTIERGVNCLLSLSNGFTAEERLDGIHLEIADWHTDLKFLDVGSLSFMFIALIAYI